MKRPSVTRTCDPRARLSEEQSSFAILQTRLIVGLQYRQIYCFRWGLQTWWEHWVGSPQTTVVSLNEWLPLHSPGSLFSLLKKEFVVPWTWVTHWQALSQTSTLVFSLFDQWEVFNNQWEGFNGRNAPENSRYLTRLLRDLFMDKWHTNGRRCCGVVDPMLQYLAVVMPLGCWFSLLNCI